MKQKDGVLDNFHQYLHDEKVKVHSFLKPRYSKEAGLGIYTTHQVQDRTKLSTHALLAAYVAFNDDIPRDEGRHAAWKATWPSFEDMRSSMPLLWSGKCRQRSEKVIIHRFEELASTESRNPAKRMKLQSSRHHPQILPPTVVGLVGKQADRFEKDFLSAIDFITAVQTANEKSPLSARERFTYAWCIVNTRCIYHRFSSSAARENGSAFQTSNNPNGTGSLVLCPLIDLCNHQPSASRCTVESKAHGLIVKSPNNYTIEPNQQLFVEYGAHSNDFLLVEYGFILPGSTNVHDSISLDSAIYPHLNLPHRQKLEDNQYLGVWTLFAPQTNQGTPEICFRTEVAALLGVLSDEDWERFIAGELDDSDIEEHYRIIASQRICNWVEEILDMAVDSIAHLDDIAGNSQELIDIFAADSSVDGNGPAETALDPSATSSQESSSISSLELARRRQALILARWKQMREICEAFLATERMVNVRDG